MLLRRIQLLAQRGDTFVRPGDNLTLLLHAVHVLLHSFQCTLEITLLLANPAQIKKKLIISRLEGGGCLSKCRYSLREITASFVESRQVEVTDRKLGAVAVSNQQ